MIPVPPPPPPLPPGAPRSSGDGASSTAASRRRKNSQIEVITQATALIDFIKSGDLDKVEESLKSGEDVNQQTIYGTPLSVAVRAGNLPIVKLLLQQPNCRMDARDYDGETAFCLSLRKKFTDISLYLLSQGCVRDGVDPVTNLSLLSTAVQLREIQIIEDMLSRGCRIDVHDNTTNFTPLTHACLLPDVEDDDVKNKIIAVLVKSGADVNIQPGPPFNGYLLHKLVMERQHQSMQAIVATSKLYKEPVNSLEINRTNAIEHNTPLHLAVALGDLEMVNILLDSGANPNLSNLFCDTPLSKALKDRLYDQSKIIRTLLEKGADVNHEDARETTRRKGPCRPIFAAIENGDKEMVDMMLKHGADLSLTDYKGHFAIMPCLENGLSISLLRYIVNMMDEQEIKYSLHISSWDYLKEAFSWPRHLQYLIDRGLDVNAVSYDGHKIIHTSDIKYSPASLEIALQNGLHPDCCSFSGEGNTMLCIIGGLSGYWEAIQLLVQYGADINKRCLLDCSNDPEDGSILSPIQKAFEVEYDQDESAYPPSDVIKSISLVRYYLNCGATLTPDLHSWRDHFLAERIEDDTDTDTSDDPNSSDDRTSPETTLREQLLCDLEVVFSPLPLRMICRNVIRTSILTCNSFTQIKSLIQTLPVPSDTKNFLSLVNVPHTHLVR